MLRTPSFLTLVVTLGGYVACSQTPTESPVRTLERSEHMDAVCMRIPLGTDQTPPTGLPETECAPPPTGLTDSERRALGDQNPKHLFGLVTQSTRGELAVVDLTSGKVVDTDKTIPGFTMVPVGKMPVGVAVLPDASAVIVAAAEANRPALYRIPTSSLLGDSVLGGVRPEIGAWPLCTLPGRPSSVVAIPRPGGGTELVVTLLGERAQPAAVAYVKSFEGNAPGQPVPCQLTAVTGPNARYDGRFAEGPSWGTGLPYAAAEVDLTGLLPGASCDSTGADAGAGDAGNEVPDAGTGGSDAGPGDNDGGAAAPIELAGAESRFGGATLADGWLYVPDEALPLVHVFDVRAPGAIREVSPLRLTQHKEQAAFGAVAKIAVSPTTRALKRYLYAVDRGQGNIAVFDITDPENGPRVALARPNPELNPLVPRDRVGFSAPAINVGFVRHDIPLQADGFARSGTLCSPDPSDVEGSAFNGTSTLAATLGPTRLRGVFAFVTLANGQVVTVDVDDWDGPCRRPSSLTASSPNTSAASDYALAPPPGTQGPYGVTLAPQNTVTDEGFFPVSAPHRVRSSRVFIKSATSNALPRLAGRPTLLLDRNTPLATVGKESLENPALLATATTLADPERSSSLEEVRSETLSFPSDASEPSVRFAYEVPDVHIDQDWTVTFEGAIPGFDAVPAVISTTNNDDTLTLSQREVSYCKFGVLDAAQGNRRREASIKALSDLGYGAAAISTYASKLQSDYAQLSDDLLAPGDPYWSEDNSCWTDVVPNGFRGASVAEQRHNFCDELFGSKASPRFARDFPILEAYDDHLVLTASVDNAERQIVRSPLRNRAARCCFHNQSRFIVRAGGQWSALGSVSGFLHHVIRDSGSGRCVESCSQDDVLKNARTTTVPHAERVTLRTLPDRNSPLAFRNPMFSFVVWGGTSQTPIARDMVWSFSTQGQFAPLAIPLLSGSVQVSPSSLRYLPGFGQLAVVDSASAGLILLDLNNVSVARSYF